jgi:DNA-binding PadR family transcriptional regulator
LLEYILLGFLTFKEMSGYDLKQTMAVSTSHFFDASFGSIYPALKKLEAKEWVRCREVVDGSKYKKLYAITDTGKTAFMDWLERPVPFSKTGVDFLVPVFFYSLLPKEIRIRQLKQIVVRAQELLDGLELQREEVKGKADPYIYSTLQFGLQYYTHMINWCSSLIQETGME